MCRRRFEMPSTLRFGSSFCGEKDTRCCEQGAHGGDSFDQNGQHTHSRLRVAATHRQANGSGWKQRKCPPTTLSSLLWTEMNLHRLSPHSRIVDKNMLFLRNRWQCFSRTNTRFEVSVEALFVCSNTACLQAYLGSDAHRQIKLGGIIVD